MKTEIKRPAPTPPPEDEVVITLTMTEARTLYTILGRCVSIDIDGIFLNCADGHSKNITGTLHNEFYRIGICSYAANGSVIETRKR